MVRKPKTSKTTRKQNRKEQIAHEKSQAELRKAQAIVARDRRKEKLKQKDGNGSIHSGEGISPRRASRRLKALQEAKDAQAKLKALQKHHRQELEDLDRMRKDIEEIDMEAQANVVPMSGGSSDSDTETDDDSVSARERLTGVRLWIHNQNKANKVNPPPKDSIDKAIEDGVFNDNSTSSHPKDPPSDPTSHNDDADKPDADILGKTPAASTKVPSEHMSVDDGLVDSDLENIVTQDDPSGNLKDDAMYDSENELHDDVNHDDSRQNTKSIEINGDEDMNIEDDEKTDEDWNDDIESSDEEDDNNKPTNGSGEDEVDEVEDDEAEDSDDQDDDDQLSVSTTRQSNNRFNPLCDQHRPTNEQNVRPGAIPILDGYTVPPFDHILFCKVKIPLPASETPTKSLHESIDVILQCLQKAAPECVIFKYKDKTNSKRITKASQIPLVLSKIKEYFDGKYRPSTTPMDAWAEIKIGFNGEEETVMEDIKYLLKENGDYLLYPKALQVEKTNIFGYLLFSVRTMCRERLIMTLEQYAEVEFKRKIKVNVIWRKIVDPVLVNRGGRKIKTQNNNGDNTTVQAYHLECENGYEDEYATLVARMYSSRRNRPPCAERMRFIGLSQRYQNSSFLRTQSQLRTKQLWFLASIGTAKSYEVTEIDYISSKVGHSLRAYIVKMRTTDGHPLFWTLDDAWNGDGTVFTFIEKYRDEAISRVADLGPYLYHHYGACVIRKYMTPAAAERARTSKWDVKRNCAVSQEEEEYDNMIQEIENSYDWLQNPNNETVVSGLPTESNSDQQQTSQRDNNLFVYAPEDDESLNTYGQLTHVTPSSNQQAHVTPDKSKTNKQRSKKRTKQPKDKSATNQTQFQEDLSDDDATIATLSSRLGALENNMTALVNALNKNINANTGNSPGQAKSKSKRRSKKPAGSMNGPAGGL